MAHDASEGTDRYHGGLIAAALPFKLPIGAQMFLYGRFRAFNPERFQTGWHHTSVRDDHEENP
jgi:hypothetical protein